MPIFAYVTGTAQDAANLAADKALNFPVVFDGSGEIIRRWNQSQRTPSSTIIDKGMVVHKVDTAWYPQMIEALLE